MEATVIGLGALLFAVGITWFAPEESSDGGTKRVCVFVDGQQVATLAAGSVNIEAIADGTTIGSCPK